MSLGNSPTHTHEHTSRINLLVGEVVIEVKIEHVRQSDGIILIVQGDMNRPVREQDFVVVGMELISHHT